MSILEHIDAAGQQRIGAIAQELSQYGLGVFAPHAHGEDGAIQPLPRGMVSYEQNLKVSFIPQTSVPSDSIAVGWRWNNGAMEVCAHCCFDPGP
jgi:hypothetical protein